MKAVLFDLDGVLIDTEDIYTKFWEAVGKEYGLCSDFAHKIKGTTLSQILNSNFAEEEHPALIKAIADYEEGMEYQIFPGVIEYLDSLKRDNVPAAIVTSSNDAKLEHLWEQHPHFKDYFSAIVTDSMVTKSKPDPEPYLIAASMLGEKPEDCVVFEDSINGVKSGRAAGCKVIGIATTNPAEALMPYADQVIMSFSELI